MQQRNIKTEHNFAELEQNLDSTSILDFEYERMTVPDIFSYVVHVTCKFRNRLISAEICMKLNVENDLKANVYKYLVKGKLFITIK